MVISMIIFCSAAAMLIGCALDLCFGDPHWRFHPICIIGAFISAAEKRLRRVFSATERGERIAGAVLVIVVCTAVFCITALISATAYMLHPFVYIITEGVMCWFLLAARSLGRESTKVYDAVRKQDIDGARRAVSMIVGRDTAALTEAGVIRAAVETVAENTSDGVIAPLMYIMLGGAPLGFLYKAVNTMDSMLGYKNEKYIDFGRAAAKLDDAVNFIPARLSALFMLAAAVLGYDRKNAWRIFRRDRLKHASPNSAQTESVCAGALGLRLAGDAYYFGKLYKKEYIGDDLRPPEAEDIKRANRLMYTASLFALAAAAAFKCLAGIAFL